MVRAPPAAVTVEQVKALTGLGNQAPIDVLKIFEEAADDMGDLSRTAFHRTFRTFLPSQSSLEYERTRVLLDTLFELFDT